MKVRFDEIGGTMVRNGLMMMINHIMRKVPNNLFSLFLFFYKKSIMIPYI